MEAVPASRFLRPSCFVATLALAFAFIAPSRASAQLADEVVQGSDIAQAVQAGERDCDSLSDEDAELIGEYAMDKFLSDRSAHEAMNAHMVQMMGAAGEERMHAALGYRYAGCAGGDDYGWMTPMMGMMGRYGGGPMGPGMMEGNQGGPPPGMGPGMMDGDGGYGPMWGAPDDDDLSAAAIVALAFGAALLGGGIVAVGLHLRHRGE